MTDSPAEAVGARLKVAGTDTISRSDPVVRAMAQVIADLRMWECPDQSGGHPADYWPGLEAMWFVAQQRAYARMTAQEA